jgi:NADH-quinone oxidoreductase subunit J
VDAITFYISGILSVVAAVLVVTRRNPVYSTIWLVGFFVTISLDFLILRAPFLAVIQVLVYAGAIMVLFLFVIMLLNLKPEELVETVTRRRQAGAAVISAAIFVALCAAISSSPTVKGAASLTAPLPEPPTTTADGLQGPLPAARSDVVAIGESMFQRHVLAFEVSSVLILIAIIGAIYLTKKRRPAAPLRIAPVASGNGAKPEGAPEAAPAPGRAEGTFATEPVGAMHP